MGPDTRPSGTTAGAGSAATFAHNTADEVMARAKELGVLARLQANASSGSTSSEGLSLRQLAEDQAGTGGGSAEELETVLNSLVQLKVVDEAEPKVYRLVNQASGDSSSRGGVQVRQMAVPVPPALIQYGVETAMARTPFGPYTFPDAMCKYHP